MPPDYEDYVRDKESQFPKVIVVKVILIRKPAMTDNYVYIMLGCNQMLLHWTDVTNVIKTQQNYYINVFHILQIVLDNCDRFKPFQRVEGSPWTSGLTSDKLKDTCSTSCTVYVSVLLYDLVYQSVVIEKSSKSKLFVEYFWR